MTKTDKQKLDILKNERLLLRDYIKKIKGNKELVKDILLMIENTDVMIR